MTTRPARALLLLLLLARVAPAADGAPPALGRPLSLEAWDAPLPEVMRTVSRETGVTLLVSPTFLPAAEVSRVRVHLDASGIPLRLALEWLARDLGCRYRQVGPESVWLSGGFDWLAKDPARHRPVAYRHRVSTLLGPRMEAGAFRETILESIRVHALLDNAFVTLEEPYLGVVAMLPPRLRDTLHATLLAMTEEGLPLDRPEPDTMEPGLARLVLALRERRVVLRYREQPLRAVLRDVSAQAGIAVVLEGRAAARLAETPVTLRTGEVTAREAIDRLRETLGLRGVELYPAGGVRLTDGVRGWPRHPPLSRAFLWEDVLVRAYDASLLETRYPSGDEMARYVRERVRPEAWRDPATGILFHEPSGNLIVVGPQGLQEEVHAELSRTALAIQRGGAAPPFQPATAREAAP